jgi:hypothetical protein
MLIYLHLSFSIREILSMCHVRFCTYCRRREAAFQLSWHFTLSISANSGFRHILLYSVVSDELLLFLSLDDSQKEDLKRGSISVTPESQFHDFHLTLGEKVIFTR